MSFLTLFFLVEIRYFKLKSVYVAFCYEEKHSFFGTAMTFARGARELSCSWPAPHVHK